MKRITVSWKWTSKEIACAPVFIRLHCQGACCKSKNYWLPKKDGSNCPKLGPEGCTFTVQEKPVVCLLYPLVIKNDKMVLHARALLHYCKPNYKIGGQTIWEQNRINLIELFGEDQFNRVLNDIRQQQDSYLEGTDEFFEQLKTEEDMFTANLTEQKNLIPPTREKGSWPI